MTHAALCKGGLESSIAGVGSEILEVRGLLQRLELESALIKARRRLIPILISIAFLNMLNRSSLAYAALSFNQDNGFDARVYSLGASLFFISFGLFQVPSNLIMLRVGFRSWMTFLICGWGIVSGSFMFIRSAWSFYLLRLLLGIFQSGAFPAMWHVLSVFFPRKQITKPYAYLTIGMMLSNMVGAPLAAGLLSMDGLGNLRGWQWLFLLEGLPCIVLGAAVFLLMPGTIASATFMTAAERAALEAEVAREQAHGDFSGDMQGAWTLLKMVLRNGYLWILSLCAMLTSVASHTFLTYTPIMINNLLNGVAISSSASVSTAQGSNSLLAVALAVVPYTLASVLSYALAHSAQRRDEQLWHVLGSLLVSGATLTLFPPLALAAPAAGFVVLSVSLAGCAASNGPAMTLVGRLCMGPEQVVAMPLFSTFSVVGGIMGPLLTGRLMSFGGFKWPAIIMGLLMVATSGLLLVLRAWVMHDGGLPDAGRGRQQPPAQDCEVGDKGGGGSRAASSLSSDNVCVVVDKDPSRPQNPKMDGT